jgi:hypothetical protein
MKDVFGTAVRIDCTVNGAVKKQRPVSADVVLSNATRSESKPAAKKQFVHRPNPKIEEIFAGM